MDSFDAFVDRIKDRLDSMELDELLKYRPEDDDESFEEDEQSP